jgi:EAL domain-containing protein (putative c-di-GMP-specific phosphodiesterase class I)
MTVVAEGVEKAAQWDFLMEAGCDVSQGYLYSPPIPERDLPDFAARLSPGARPKPWALVAQ